MNVDVCIIGAGPAGLAASETAAAEGKQVVVVDEMPEPGGRLLGQLHQAGRRNDEYHVDGWWYGRQIAARLFQSAQAAGVQFLFGSSVWGLFPQWKICLAGEHNVVVQAPVVILATGAAEVPAPIDGWHLPGVMTVGAAQVMSTQHRIRPGNNAIVAGINPLSIAIAHELELAGVNVRAIVGLPSGLSSVRDQAPQRVLQDLGYSAHLSPSWLLRRAGTLAKYGAVAAIGTRLLPYRGIRVWHIPLQPHRACVEISGDTQVERATIEDLDARGNRTGRTQDFDVDLVCLSGGLRPLAELADLAGLRTAYVPEVGGRVPLYGRDLETAAPGVYVAGNITGIESGMVAIAQGRLAAAKAIGSQLTAEFRAQVDRARSTAPIQFMPDHAAGRERIAQIFADQGTFAVPEARSHVHSSGSGCALAGDDIGRMRDDVVLCRCEEVTAGQVKSIIQLGYRSAEEIKRHSRMTMGACQGRICHPILEQIQLQLAGTRDGPAPMPGHRAPIRPVLLEEMAQLGEGHEEYERLHGSLTPAQPFDDGPGDR